MREVRDFGKHIRINDLEQFQKLLDDGILTQTTPVESCSSYALEPMLCFTSEKHMHLVSYAYPRSFEVYRFYNNIMY